MNYVLRFLKLCWFFSDNHLAHNHLAHLIIVGVGEMVQHFINPFHLLCTVHMGKGSTRDVSNRPQNTLW